MKTTLQIPINHQLKNEAERVAEEQGFSSLQEVVRVFLAKFASHKVEISIQEPLLLSEENEKRYLKMSEDFESGRNVYSAKNADELLAKLHGN